MILKWQSNEEILKIQPKTPIGSPDKCNFYWPFFQSWIDKRQYEYLSNPSRNAKFIHCPCLTSSIHYSTQKSIFNPISHFLSATLPTLMELNSIFWPKRLLTNAEQKQQKENSLCNLRNHHSSKFSCRKWARKKANQLVSIASRKEILSSITSHLKWGNI